MNTKWLDLWIAQKHGLDMTSRAALEEYQRAKLRETVACAVQNSSFYSRLYSHCDTGDFENLPFTTPEDLKNYGEDMLCVRASEVSRIVTLHTSGTTGRPKRIYFTAQDQELTVDYFANGMRFMASKGDRALILFPHTSEGSIGLLLKTALERTGVEAVFEPQGHADCVIGAPEYVAQLSEARPDIRAGRVLLSSDYVSAAARQRISQNWGSRIFEHYGMTEMGLGCAVSCGQGAGYHIRENDIYIEILSPETGRPVSDGQWGEIVFTTLTRQAMPFIRYRTGDISRWITDECACGSVLKRIDRVKMRR
jgi:phenylacetate-CoA ligase